MSGVPNPVIRFVALVFCPGYLWLLAVILSRWTGQELYQALVVVFVGGVALLFLYAGLAANFFQADKSKRYTIGNAMLVTAVIAVYFGYIGQFLTDIREEPFNSYGIFIFAIYSCFFVGTSTIVLLYFADALIAIIESLNALVQRIRGR